MAPSRRSVLASVGAAAAGGLTWGAVLADPDRLGAPPAGSDCPAPGGGGGPDRVVCSDLEDRTVRFALGGESVENGPDGADLRFRLRNTLPRVLSWNPFRWLVWARRGDRWFRAYPRLINQPLGRILPGDTVSWRLRVDPAADAGDDVSRQDGVVLGGLGGGEYAVSTTVSTGDTDVRLATRFELSTPPVELVAPDETGLGRYGPTRATELVEDGDIRVAREPDADEPRELVVERTDAGPDRWLVPEQAVRRWPLRDALAWFEPGVDRVVLRADTEFTPPFRLEDPFVVRYGDARFRVTSPGPDG